MLHFLKTPNSSHAPTKLTFLFLKCLPIVFNLQKGMISVHLMLTKIFYILAFRVGFTLIGGSLANINSTILPTTGSSFQAKVRKCGKELNY